MASYELRLKASAVKELESIGSKKDRLRILARIEALPDIPRPKGSEKLAGAESAYRIRQGNYRIVYTIDDNILLIEVITVGHRREVYRKY